MLPARAVRQQLLACSAARVASPHRLCSRQGDRLPILLGRPRRGNCRRNHSITPVRLLLPLPVQAAAQSLLPAQTGVCGARLWSSRRPEPNFPPHLHARTRFCLGLGSDLTIAPAAGTAPPLIYAGARGRASVLLLTPVYSAAAALQAQAAREERSTPALRRATAQRLSHVQVRRGSFAPEGSSASTAAAPTVASVPADNE